jgi:hypothetical protein
MLPVKGKQKGLTIKRPKTPQYFLLKSQILRQPVGVLLIHRKKLSPTLTTSTFPAIILKMRLTQLPKLLLFQSFKFFFQIPLDKSFPQKLYSDQIDETEP